MARFKQSRLLTNALIAFSALFAFALVSLTGEAHQAFAQSALSISIDVNGIFTQANSIINAMNEIIKIAAGLSLGFNLVWRIIGIFRGAW